MARASWLFFFTPSAPGLPPPPLKPPMVGFPAAVAESAGESGIAPDALVAAVRPSAEIS